MPPEVLAQLRGLHLPEAPGWWPPAPGWWLLAILLLVLVYRALRHMQRARLSRRPLVEARRELAGLNQALADRRIAPMHYLDQVNALLKRLLVYGYGQRQVLSLSADIWVRALTQFLRQAGGSEAAMRVDTSLLGEFRYRPHAAPDCSVAAGQEQHSACERLGMHLDHALRRLSPPEVCT